MSFRGSIRKWTPRVNSESNELLQKQEVKGVTRI